MVRIPTNEETVRLSGGVQQDLPTNLFGYEQAQANNFANTAKNAFDDIAKKFKQAENINILEREKNSLMDAYYKLDGDVSNQPLEQREGYYNQKAKDIQQGMVSRLQGQKVDPAIIEQLQSYSLHHTETGMYRTRDEVRRETASNGVATVEDGNNLFINNIQSYVGQPQIFQQELDKRNQSIDGLVAAGHINAAQAQRMREQVANTATFSLAKLEAEKDPYAIRDQLEDPKQWMGLGAHRPTMVNFVNGEIHKREAEARAEARQALMERKAEAAALIQPAMDALKASRESGSLVEGYDVVQSSLSKYQDIPMVSKLYHAMSNLNGDLGALKEDKATPLSELNTKATELREKLANNQLDATQTRQAVNTIRYVDGLVKADNGGDALEYLGKHNSLPKGSTFTPLDINDPATILQRVRSVTSANEIMGKSVVPVTDGEMKGLVDAWKNGSQTDRQQIAKTFKTLSGGDDATMNKLIGSVAKHDASISVELGYLQAADKESFNKANAIALGRDRSKKNPDAYEGVNTPAYMNALNSALQSQGILNFHPSIDVNGAAAKPVVDSARYYYMGIQDKPITNTSTPASDASGTMSKFLESDIQHINGQTVLDPFGGLTNSYDAQRKWNALTPDLFKKSTGTDKAYSISATGSFQEVPFSKVISKAVPITNGDGTVSLAVVNSPFFGKDTISYLADANGKRIKMNLASIRGDLVPAKAGGYDGEYYP